MDRMMFDYTKSLLEKVSFDLLLFKKELNKAFRNLKPHEIEILQKWLDYFTANKPELESCVNEIVNKYRMAS